MFPCNHLLVLSQPDFLEYQLSGVLVEPEAARPTGLRRLWNWSSARRV